MNNDQNPPSFSPAPFPPYQEGVPLPGTPHTASEQPAKKRGGRRGPRGPKPDKPVKRGRPKKIDKTKKLARVPQTVATSVDTGLKISVASAFDILRGLDVIESESLQKCLLAVGGLGKKSRERVLAALTRVVA